MTKDAADQPNHQQVAMRQPGGNGGHQHDQHAQDNGNSPAATPSTRLIDFGKEPIESDQILELLRGDQLWMVNSRRRNGLILCKSFHAEFAGPGSAVGSFFDEDCQRVIPVGNLSLVCPEDHEDRQKAYLIRRQWIRLTHQLTDKPVPIQRAQSILNQFETYFDSDTVSRIPDDIFASLVGVLPYTVRLARRTPGQLNVKVKT
jgi:hypothetical protein